MRASAPVPKVFRFPRTALPIALLAAIGPLAHAADSPPAKPPVESAPALRSLTLDDALALGLKNNRDLQAARARLRGSKADVEKALAPLLPTLNFQGKLTINEPVVTLDLPMFGLSATITPRLQIDGLINANLPLIAPSLYPAHKGARLAYEAQERQLEATTIQILTTAASSFYAAAGNDELVSARRHGIEVAQKTLDNAQVRLAAGVVNKVEVTRAGLALIQAEQRLLEAKDSQAAAYRTLATAILIENGSFRVVPASDTSVELADEARLIDMALHQRPELLSTQLQVDAFKQQSLSSLLRWSPSLSAFGNIRLTNATGFAGRADGYSAGLQLDWQLFDGFGRDAQRHSWDSQQRDAQLRLEQLRDTISDDVINGRRTVLTKKQGLVTADRSVQMAQETLGLVRTQYAAGTATQLDLLNAQDALIQAEVGLAQARFDLSLALLNLRRLSGDTLSGPAK